MKKRIVSLAKWKSGQRLEYPPSGKKYDLSKEIGRVIKK